MLEIGNGGGFRCGEKGEQIDSVQWQGAFLHNDRVVLTGLPILRELVMDLAGLRSQPTGDYSLLSEPVPETPGTRFTRRRLTKCSPASA